MTLTDHLPDWLATRLPDDGAMGALQRKRPSLYWLTLGVGATAFVAVLLALFYAIALLPLFAGRAVLAAIRGGAVEAVSWLVLFAAAGVLVVGVVYLAGRWASEFGREGEG